MVAATVLNKGIENPDYKNCGTTLTGFYIEGDEFFTINVGDSRVYKYSNRSLKQLTKDHSKVQRLIDTGMITEEEAFTHPERNIMTSAIGQPIEMMTVDIKGPYEINKNEMLLAFSDGVHDALKDHEITAIINEYEDSGILAEIIVDKSFKAGSKDNITVCTYRHI